MPVFHPGTLPLGTYYVGDLCYVIDNDDWNDYCDQSFPGDNSEHIGVFENRDGIGYVMIGTKYGDGLYRDQFWCEYSVDSGSIGCIPISAMANKYDEDEIKRLGNIVSFDQPFDCGYDDETGTIRIGHIEIVTGHFDWDPEDEYDYDYDSEDDDE